MLFHDNGERPPPNFSPVGYVDVQVAMDDVFDE